MVTIRRGTGMPAGVAVLVAGVIAGSAPAVPGTAFLGVPYPSSIALPAQAWMDVTDQPSGVSVKLPGQATPQDVSRSVDGKSIKGRAYRVVTGDNAIIFIVWDVPGSQFDLEKAIQDDATRGGIISSSQKTTVDGRPGLDARITITVSGIRLVSFSRYIAADTHVVLLATTGPVADEKAVKQLHQQLLAGVRIP
jgi:hypothetical protein